MRSQEAMQDNAEGAPGSGTAGLAHLLLSSYQEQLLQNRLQEEQEREKGAEEEEEDEEDGGKWWMNGHHCPSVTAFLSGAASCIPLYFSAEDSVQQKEDEPTSEEKALFREEFITQMYQRFLDGKDKDFNYRSDTQPFIGLQ